MKSIPAKKKSRLQKIGILNRCESLNYGWKNHTRFPSNGGQQQENPGWAKTTPVIFHHAGIEGFHAMIDGFLCHYLACGFRDGKSRPTSIQVIAVPMTIRLTTYQGRTSYENKIAGAFPSAWTATETSRFLLRR